MDIFGFLDWFGGIITAQCKNCNKGNDSCENYEGFNLIKANQLLFVDELQGVFIVPFVVVEVPILF